MIKGITILLYERTKVGNDALGNPIYEEDPVEVENVLVAPSTEEEITETTNLYGRKAIYTLGIPKSDSHQWEGKKVRFFGEDYRAIGKPIKGIDSMIPLEWNMKVRVEHIDGKSRT